MYTPNNFFANNSQQNNKTPRFNEVQFKQIVPQLTDNILQQFVEEARRQGISDGDITAGLQYINSLR